MPLEINAACKTRLVEVIENGQMPSTRLVTYPMTAPKYSATRSTTAKRLGLGKAPRKAPRMRK